MAAFLIALCVMLLLLIILYSPVTARISLDGELVIAISFVFFGLELRKRKERGSKHRKAKKEKRKKPIKEVILSLIEKCHVVIKKITLPHSFSYGGTALYNSLLSAFLVYIGSKAKKLTLENNVITASSVTDKPSLIFELRCSLISGALSFFPLLR